ncbi:unnamed protein product [Rhizoctonia solani]|uniref:Uncharacterized protein n=1 Tax=Rhizoctonia solani TaxID=456999 RepID=A0A8H3CEZ1_9AGAM|nr:unnamed protein product [Rhizoctonia solani]
MDALDLDHSYCARCETYIWPEKRQVEVQVPAKATPAPPTAVTKSKSGTIKASARSRATDSEPTDKLTKIRTVISLDRAPLYCSEKCRQLDQESGSANGRRIMEHFQPSPSSCSPSPISPSYDRSQHNIDYFTRIAGGSLPWTRRPSTTSNRSTTSMSSLELLEEHRQWSRALLAESAERLSHSDSRAAISAESTTLPKPKSKPNPPKRDQDEAPAPIPFSHRRWKEGSKDLRLEMSSRSVDVDVAALYDQYPMSQRVRSASSFGSSSSMRRGSMTSSTISDTASIRTTSSRGSTRRQGALSADATRGLLVPAVMIREGNDSTHSVHSGSDEEPETYFSMRRNRTITQRNHDSKSSSDAPRSPRPRDHKTIQELVREAGGPEYHKRQGSRPVSCAPSEFSHSGPLYEVIRTPPGPVKRHAIHEVEVDGKHELRIVEQTCWEPEEPQKLFHFMV